MSLFASSSAQVVQLNSRKPAPRLTLLDTITVTAIPGAVTFALVSKGAALGSGSIAVTTTWSGVSLLSSLTGYAFFTSATAALSSAAPVSSIPTSCVFGQVPTGSPTSFTAFTQTGPFGVGSSLQLYSSTTILSLGGSRTDNLSLKIDLTSLPQLPAATYTGILYLQAQAF